MGDSLAGERSAKNGETVAGVPYGDVSILKTGGRAVNEAFPESEAIARRKRPAPTPF